ncbi:MAG: hypothetical protein JSU61_04665 [Fidelibacterota bacterium]|nr:MAG: hypothetical protein JSU61_04665 [Candidatus Neomarinimicrobiota bacterium]
MKVLEVTAIPLASVLLLAGGLLATRDYSAIEKPEQSYEYETPWYSSSFDETVWLAVDDIARIEDNLPPEVTRFRIEVQPSGNDFPALYLEFDRVYLAQLKAGEISPEFFIREHVDFN